MTADLIARLSAAEGPSRELDAVNSGTDTHACLMALFALHESHGEERCFYFRSIEEYTGFPRSRVRRAVRRLAKIGLAEFQRGLFDEDGQTAGSGYMLTETAIAALRARGEG